MTFPLTYANTSVKLIARIVLYASPLFFLIVSSTAFGTDSVSNLETVASSARPALVSESIIDSSRDTKELVFDVDFAFTGKQRELKLENAYPSSPNGTGKLVTSSRKGFAFVDTNPIVKSKETFDGKFSTVYMYKDNRLIQVDSDCQLPLVNPLVAFFCRITGASCWHSNNSEACSCHFLIRRHKVVSLSSMSCMGRRCHKFHRT